MKSNHLGRATTFVSSLTEVSLDIWGSWIRDVVFAIITYTIPTKLGDIKQVWIMQRAGKFGAGYLMFCFNSMNYIVGNKHTLLHQYLEIQMFRIPALLS